MPRSNKFQFVELYGYAPFRFSYLTLRTAILPFRMIEASFVYQDERGFLILTHRLVGQAVGRHRRVRRKAENAGVAASGSASSLCLALLTSVGKSKFPQTNINSPANISILCIIWET